MKRIIDVDENLICEGFVRNFTEEEKDALINAIRNSIPYEEKPKGEWISKEEALKIMCEKCPVYNCVSKCSSYRSIEKCNQFSHKDRQ